MKFSCLIIFCFVFIIANYSFAQTSGNIQLTNNGVAPAPAFALGAPAILSSTVIRKNKFYFNPEFNLGIDGKLHLGLSNSPISNNSALTTDQWNHVLISWDAGWVRYYINGKPENDISWTGFNSIAMGNYLGITLPGSSLLVGTIIDQFAVYTQSMQTAEVEKLYASELPRHMLAKAGK